MGATTAFAGHGAGGVVATPEGRLYYELEGEGGRLPVVVLGDGPGVGHSHFHPWFSALADRFDVVYFDYIGTGRSSRLESGTYSIELFAEHLEVLRGHLGLDRWSLVGHSFGGMPALEYALRHQGRVSALALSNAQLSAATWQEGNIDHVNAALRAHFPERWSELLALRDRGVRSLHPDYQALLGDVVERLEWFDPAGHPRLEHDEHNGVREDVYAAIVGDDPEWRVTGTMAGFDPMPRMAALDVPTLVLTGRWDRTTTPQIARLAVDALPDRGADLVVFERSAHRPSAEQPLEYFAALSAFLARHAGDAWSQA